MNHEDDRPSIHRADLLLLLDDALELIGNPDRNTDRHRKLQRKTFEALTNLIHQLEEEMDP